MANDKDRILLNLGVQVDQQQTEQAIKDIKAAAKKHKVKVDGEFVVDKAGIEQITKSLDIVKKQFKNAVGGSQELKEALADVNEILLNFEKALKGANFGALDDNADFLKESFDEIKKAAPKIKEMGTATKEVAKETKKVAQANKETAKATKEVTKAAKEAEKVEKSKAKQVKKNATQQKKASQEIKKETKATNDLIKEQNQLLNKNEKQRRKIQSVKTISTKTSNQINNQNEVEKVNQYWKDKGTRVTQLDSVIDATWKLFAERLQRLGAVGVEGDTDKAKENVYKGIQAIEALGKEISIRTGQTFENLDQVFDYIEQNVSAKNSLSDINFKGDMQKLFFTLDNQIEGSITEYQATITHVQENVADAAERMGVSQELMLEKLAKVFEMDDYELYYKMKKDGMPDSEYRITSERQLNQLLDSGKAKYEDLTLWSKRDTVVSGFGSEATTDGVAALKRYEEVWKDIIEITKQYSHEMLNLNRKEVLDQHTQQLEEAKKKLQDIQDTTYGRVSDKSYVEIDEKYIKKQAQLENKAKMALQEKSIKEEQSVQRKAQQQELQQALSDYRSFLAQKEKAKQQYEHQTTIGKVSTPFEDTVEGKAFEAGLKAKIANIEKLTQSVQEATVAIDKMDQAEADSGKHEATGLQNKTKQLDEYRRNAEEIAKLEKRANIAHLNSEAQGFLMTGKQKSAYAQIEMQLREQITLLEKKQQSIREALPDLQKETNEIDEQLGKAKEMARLEASVDGTTRNGFGERFRNAFQRIFDYTVTYKLINAAQEALRTGYQYLYDYDEALTNLRIVTGETREETVELMKTYNKLGQELGATTIEVAEAANDWLRQGYSAEESTELITASVRLSKLGMIETSEATEYLTSALRGYGLEVQDVIGVVDKLTAVDLKAAVSAGDLAVAMSRTASSAKMAGVDQNTLLGYLATVQEVTQKSAETVGESFKSIFSRFGNVKAGKFVDDETGESLNDIEKVLGEVGIALRSDNDTFRETDEVLAEVAGQWENYTDVERNAIATAVAGTRQRENFIVLMENWEKAIEYAGTAANSAGTSFKKMKAYSESLEGSIATLKATFQELVTTLVSSQELIDVVQGLTRFIETLNGLDWEGIKKAASIIAGIIAFAAGGAKLAGMISTLSTAIAGLGAAVATGGAVAAGGIAAVTSAALPLLGIVLAVGVAVAALSGAFETAEHKMSTYKKELQELNEQQEEELKLIKQYEELMAKSKSIGITTEEKENLKLISEELVNTYDIEASGIDKVTGAYELNTKAIKENLEAKEAEEKVIKDKINQGYKKEINKINDDIDNITKRDVLGTFGLSTGEKAFYDYESESVDFIYRAGHAGISSEAIRAVLDKIDFNADYFGQKAAFEEAKKQIDSEYAGSNLDPQLVNELKQKYLEAFEHAIKVSLTYYGQYAKERSELISDIILNNLSGDISSDTETFLTTYLEQYLTETNQGAVEDFLVKYDGIISNLVGEKARLEKKIFTDTVDSADFEQYKINLQRQLDLIARIFGVSSTEYKKELERIQQEFSGFSFFRLEEIGKNLKNTGTNKAASRYATFTETFAQLENQLRNGTKTFEQYFQDFKKALTTLDVKKTFQNDEQAMSTFFNEMFTEGRNALEYLNKQWKNGKYSVVEYLDNLDDVVDFYSDFGDKILNSGLVKDAKLTNSIKSDIKSLKDFKTEIGNIQKVIPLMGKSYEDFANMSAKETKELEKALTDAGITAVDINGQMVTGVNNIVEAWKTGVTEWQDGCDDIQSKTTNMLVKIATAVNSLMTSIKQIIGNTQLSLAFDTENFSYDKDKGFSGSIKFTTNFDYIGDALTEDEIHKGIALIKGYDPNNLTKEQLIEIENEAASHVTGTASVYDRTKILNALDNAINDITTNGLTTTATEGNHSATVSMSDAAKEKVLSKLIEAKTKISNTKDTTEISNILDDLNDINYYNSMEFLDYVADFFDTSRRELNLPKFNFTPDKVNTLDSEFESLIRTVNGMADPDIIESFWFGSGEDPDDPGGSGDGSASVAAAIKKHYAVIFQDLLQAMLQDKQDALDDFEKENDRLNDELTHSLELQDNEGAKRVYDTMAQNKKQYEQELQAQLKWAQDIVNNQLLPAINKLVPDFTIASADDMTNTHKQKIQYYFDDKLSQIESDLHYLEQLDEDDLTQATKNTLISKLSDKSLANDVKKSIAALEDEQNALENTEEAVMTNIDTLLEFRDNIEETSDTLVASQRDISNYKSAIDGVIDNETERIETALEKFKMTPDEAIAAYEDLFNYLKYEFYPQSEAEAKYRAEKMDEILRERVEATKDNYSQIYSDAGTIKDYEVGLLQDEIDKINDKYDEQIEELENKRDIQEETNDLIEAETRLRNAQREKNKRVYREGLGFVWEADQSEIDDARKELEDLQLDKQISDLEKAQEEEVKAVQESIDAWEEWYKKLTNQMDLVEVNYARLRLGIEKEAGKITVAIMEQKEVFEELVQAIEDAREAQEEWEDYEDDYSGSSGITQQEKDHANSILNNYNKGSGSNSSGGGSKGKYTGSKTETGATLGDVYSGAGTRDESYVDSDGRQYVPGLGYVGTVSKNATGDKSFKGGLSMVGEQGAELTVLPRGTGILPNPITENLWEFGSNPAAYLDKLSLASIHTKGTTTNSTTSTTNEYMNIGTINLPNVTSAKQFVQELKSTVKRTKNTK